MVCEILQAECKQTFWGSKVLPSPLPRSDYLVVVTDTTKHKIWNQVKSRSNRDQQVLALSNKSDRTKKQLAAKGFDLRVEAKEEMLAKFTAWPGVVPFVEKLVLRHPGVTLDDLIRLRHCEMDTPIRGSMSSDSIATARRVIRRRMDMIQDPYGPGVHLDVLKKTAEEHLKGLDAPPRDPLIERRIELIDRTVTLLHEAGRVPTPFYFGPRALKDIEGLPEGWNGIADSREIAVLTRDIPRDKEMTLQEYQKLFRAALNGATPEPAPKIEVVASNPITITWSNALDFWPEMLKALPNLSLRDMAWLRQQPEVWAARMGDRGVYAFCCIGAGSWMGRRLEDEKILDVAYRMLSSEDYIEPPRITKNLRMIGKIAANAEKHAIYLPSYNTLPASFISRIFELGIDLDSRAYEEVRDLTAGSITEDRPWDDTEETVISMLLADLISAEASPQKEIEMEEEKKMEDKMSKILRDLLQEMGTSNILEIKISSDGTVQTKRVVETTLKL